MASTQVQTVHSSADKMRLGVAALLAAMSVIGFYLWPQQESWLKWLVLLLGLVIAAVVFLLSTFGSGIVALARDSWRELQKVVWPERKEAIMMTAYVFGCVLLMAVFLWLTDKTLEWFIYDLVLGWRK